jgi:hypothetical protein
MREGSSREQFQSIPSDIDRRLALITSDNASLVTAAGFEFIAESCDVSLQDL